MSNNSSNPPFSIGQRVVALRDQADGDFEKGSDHVVRSMHQCSKCKVWFVDVGIGCHKINPDEYDVCDQWLSRCSLCECIDTIMGSIVFEMYKVDYFAPIQTQYISAIEEILSKHPITEEVPDRIVNEPVNN